MLGLGDGWTGEASAMGELHPWPPIAGTAPVTAELKLPVSPSEAQQKTSQPQVSLLLFLG